MSDEEPTIPTPAEGQIWERRIARNAPQALRVEAFVPDTRLGQLVVYTWCGHPSAPAQIEHVEVFLRRSTYSHGGPT